MQKIPTMFERDWEGDRSRVLDKVTPGCEWVLEGEGNALRKYDGTCVMFDGERWWARREVKDGKKPPAGFVSSGHDHITLKNVGWEPIEQSPFAKFWAEAEASGPRWDTSELWEPGTYELVGPKIQGNHEQLNKHGLIKHDLCEGVGNLDRTFEGIKQFLSEADWEGIVFHHPDGRRLAKIKGRDFGIRRS
jgi:hypothetical protein